MSRGRTIREYVIGAMIIPSLICLVWFTFIGATAIDLELSGVAQGAIVNADISAQLFETINLILSPTLAVGLSVVIVVLLLTFLVTSADSGILIINTLASGVIRAKSKPSMWSFGNPVCNLDWCSVGRRWNGCVALSHDYWCVAVFYRHGANVCVTS